MSEREGQGRKALSRSVQGKSEVSKGGSREVKPADHGGPDTTATLQPLAEAPPEMWLRPPDITPHVFLSVPNLGVDRIDLKVENLRARVNLDAKILDLVALSVGVEVSVDTIELEIDNVRVQAMLQADLSPVVEIVHDVVGMLNEHPEILTNLTEGLGEGLAGSKKLTDQSGDEE